MADFRNMNAFTNGAGALSFDEKSGVISLTQRDGSHVTLNKLGLTLYTPGTVTQLCDDKFDSTKGDSSQTTKGNHYPRIDGDILHVQGDSTAFQLNAYQAWSDSFGSIAAANATHSTTVAAAPAVPGVAVESVPTSIPQGTNAPNPATEYLKTNPPPNKALGLIKGVTTISSGILTAVQQVQKVVAAAQKLYQDAINFPAKLAAEAEALAAKAVGAAKSALLGSFGTPLSPSTQGGNYTANTNKEQISQSIVATQEKLNQIESVMGSGGSQTHNVARDYRLTIGAAVNDHPQASINLTGRQMNKSVVVSSKGVAVQPDADREVLLVDNHSTFPCGNYIVEAGNQIMMSAGGGGVTIHSGVGAVTIMSHVTTTIGSANQTVISGPSMIINANNLLITGHNNINIDCPGQVVFGGNVGMSTNLLVQGGAYINGELFVTHITSPTEIQQTYKGFTEDGARGTLVPGEAFRSTVYMDPTLIIDPSKTSVLVTSLGTITVYSGTLQGSLYGESSINVIENPSTIISPLELGLTFGSKIAAQPLMTQQQIELFAHAHEFPNIPFTLVTDANFDMLNEFRAAAVAINDPVAIVVDNSSFEKPTTNKTETPNDPVTGSPQSGMSTNMHVPVNT